MDYINVTTFYVYPSGVTSNLYSEVQMFWERTYATFGNNDFNIFVYGGFIVFLITFWSIGGIFLILDLTGKPMLMLNYKIQNNAQPKYPLTSIRPIVDLLLVAVSNELIGLLLYILIFYSREALGIKINHVVPGLYTTIVQFLIFAEITEFGIYYSHRLLHYPKIYKRIHKKHHSWISPIAISSIYCHPIEQIITNILPVIVGPLLLNSHLFLHWIWIAIAVGTTLVVHSGFHLPFLPSPEFHDFHHLTLNGNYGVLGLLDYLHGTDELFRKSKEFERHKTIFRPDSCCTCNYVSVENVSKPEFYYVPVTLS